MSVAEQKLYDAIEVNALAIGDRVDVVIVSYVFEHLVDFGALLDQFNAFLLLRFNQQLLCLQDLI